MGTTNYFDTLIAVADDCTAVAGTEPPAKASPTVAARMWKLIHDDPYCFTSDDVLFAVFADRNDIADDDRAAAREQFFARGQPCLRASPLGKTYGWGIHHDADGRVALLGVETGEYAELCKGNRDGTPLNVIKAMRSTRR